MFCIAGDFLYISYFESSWVIAGDLICQMHLHMLARRDILFLLARNTHGLGFILAYYHDSQTVFPFSKCKLCFYLILALIDLKGMLNEVLGLKRLIDKVSCYQHMPP